MPDFFGVRRLFIAAACLSLITVSACRDQRQQIRAVGSATVFPFSAAAAEHFGEISSFKTPIVEAIGTGGGIALFCKGAGVNAAADFANASRRMKESERADCAAHGVKDVIEIPLGYDGLVIAETKSASAMNVTLQQLFLAVMKDVPKGGKIVPNPYHRWNEIDPALPDRVIEVYGPASASGTRDTLVDLLSEAGCGAPEYKAVYPDEKARKEACKLIREDGAYIQGREDYNAIVLKLTANPEAVGIFGYSFLADNAEKLQAASIGGVAPSEQSIANGSYTLARVLYTYAKGENLGIIPGMAEFAAELVSEEAVGPDGYLTLKGLIPLPPEQKAEARDTVAAMQSRR